MLPKTDEPLVYKRQVEDKACTICIHVDELANSDNCADCIDSDLNGNGKSNWENAFGNGKG